MKKKIIWTLVCNGPGTLGGPMGTEHEGGPNFPRITFEALADAKKYAEDWFKKAQRDDNPKKTIDWRESSNKFSWDADMSWCLFHIYKDEIVPARRKR